MGDNDEIGVYDPVPVCPYSALYCSSKTCPLDKLNLEGEFEE
jgi:hypothetical protein